MNELEDILNYLETTSLEPHDDYTSEISYKKQKILWNHIKELQRENQELKSELELYENGVYYSSELDKKDKEIEELKKQQEEFLELLEGMYFETEDKWWLKILEKYKEIIGVEDEQN